MTEHFWLRKAELVGTRKPPCDSLAVRRAYEARVAEEKREEASRSAAGRLWRAMGAWKVAA